MHLLGINANIMSLGGIAIAIGVMVDSAIIMVENAHKHLDRDEERVHARRRRRGRAVQIILEAAKEVGPSLFFSPADHHRQLSAGVRAGRRKRPSFRPLAFTKTFAMAAASLLSVTIIPVLMVYFITARVLPRHGDGRSNLLITLAAMIVPAVRFWFAPDVLPETGTVSLVDGGRLGSPGGDAARAAEDHSRGEKSDQPGIAEALRPVLPGRDRFRWPVLVLAVLFVASAMWPFLRLGSEFMPPLDEGDLLYMPTTDPSISITKARQVLQQTDKLIKTFPEVVSVYGKIGRAETATDPAPLDMVETVVRLKTDPAQWRQRTMHYWFDGWLRAG